MRNKSVIYIGVALIALSMVAYLFMPKGNPPVEPLAKAPASSFEPNFKYEGDLSFFDQSSSQEIKKIRIEVAENEQEVQQGLMYRKSMPDSIGMLFIFDRMEPQNFWMKNTLVSLDIIYVDNKNQIVTISPKNEPLSTKEIPSIRPAQYVVEVVGGFCEQFGVKEGDFVSYKIH